MILTSKHYLKWIDLNKPMMANCDFTLINKCVLVGSEKGQVMGFTLFEPRDLNKEFFVRLQQRVQRPESSHIEFSFYLPPFLKHRYDTLTVTMPELRLNLHQTCFLRIKKSGSRTSLQRKIRVVNVDDSPVLLKFLKHTIEETEFIEVIEQVSDSKKAVAVIERLKPDLVTMDIQMPDKTGVEVVKELSALSDVPVIMISSLSLEEGSEVFEALNAGAFDYIQKPKLEDKEEFKADLNEKIMAAIDGVKTNNDRIKPTTKSKLTNSAGYLPKSLWCFGASTGGTKALTDIMRTFPDQIPPTLIVQHIPPLFSKAFADSMNKLCPFTVKEAANGEIVKDNHVYVAPGGLQMGIEQKGAQLFIVLSDSDPVNRFKPSVDFLFNEVSKLTGFTITAALLTGMGKDGAEGLLKLKTNGAHTIAQDQKSSAVYGMPRQAFEIGATCEVLSLYDIPEAFMRKSAAKKLTA